MDNGLYRETEGKMIAGVCAGLARRFDLNVTGMRWLVALVTIFLSGIPALAYLVLWMVLKPRRP